MTNENVFPYIYAWGPRGSLPGAMSRKGERCRIVLPPPGKRAAMNSALIEFQDQFQAVVSRNALRRDTPMFEPLDEDLEEDPDDR